MSAEELSKSEKTKKYIIEKTASIFNKKGYAGTSISDLTDATGLTKGSIYGNFQNKDEVALHAFRRNADFIIMLINKEMNSAPTYFEKLMVYPVLYKKMARHIIPFGGCPIINTLVESDDTHEPLRREALSIIDLWRKTIVSLVETGIKAGEIKSETDPEKTAELLISLTEGSVAMTKATGSVSYVITAMDYLEQKILEMKA